MTNRLVQRFVRKRIFREPGLCVARRGLPLSADDAVDGGSAQGAGVPRWLGERVNSTRGLVWGDCCQGCWERQEGMLTGAQDALGPTDQCRRSAA